MRLGMTRKQALKDRAEALAQATRCVNVAQDERMPWGKRYAAAVYADHFMDEVERYTNWLRKPENA